MKTWEVFKITLVDKESERQRLWAHINSRGAAEICSSGEVNRFTGQLFAVYLK